MKISLGPQTLVYPTPVWCIGTYNGKGKPNVMTVSWGGVCSSQPPCVAVSIRKATYTYGNLIGTKAFTISIPPKKYAKEADFFGIFSGKNIDKFKETGLTPEKADKVDAPYIKEFPMVIQCKVIQTSDIGLHTQFIGEIVDVKADTDVISKDGTPDIQKVDPFIYATGNHHYHGISESIGEGFEIGKGVSK